MNQPQRSPSPSATAAASSSTGACRQTPQRLSPHYLFILRNTIPIDSLIRSLPSLAPKNCNRILRFLCPRCRGFHTATNPKTNLARCFQCAKNFNTIDLVMLVKNLPFRHAVAWLSSFRKHLQDPACRPTHLTPAPIETPTVRSSPFASIREILERVLANTPRRSPR